MSNVHSRGNNAILGAILGDVLAYLSLLLTQYLLTGVKDSGQSISIHYILR